MPPSDPDGPLPSATAASTAQPALAPLLVELARLQATSARLKLDVADTRTASDTLRTEGQRLRRKSHVIQRRAVRSPAATGCSMASPKGTPPNQPRSPG